MKKFLLLLTTIAALSYFTTSCSDDNGGGEEPPPPEIEVDPGMNLYGLITDTGGSPVSGVVVSDGYQCVETNSKGVYQMVKNENASFVFYSLPAEYAVEMTRNNYPTFFSQIGSQARHDFKLTPSTKETDFTLFCIADPQVTSATEVERFRKEIMPAVARDVKASGNPSYGLALGDIVGDVYSLMSTIRTSFNIADIPIWATIGNHDKEPAGTSSQPRENPTYSAVFGPVDYSFNRGDVHFICLDNVRYSNSSSYSGGLTEEQVAWALEDLKFVSKDKMVILFYHIPIRGAGGNYATLIEALKEYKEVHFMAGHTHYNENYLNSSARGSIYEHIHGAACGAWWHSNINGDGTPNGYAVYDVRGTTITNWVYKGHDHDENYQIRLHKGSDICGGTYEQFPYTAVNSTFNGNTVIANVFNADANWSVRLFENGADMGQMTLLGSVNEPWAVGYHIGVVGRGYVAGGRDNYLTACKHLYYKQLTTPGATVKVVATDNFGNVYEQSVFTAEKDYADARSPS